MLCSFLLDRLVAFVEFFRRLHFFEELLLLELPDASCHTFLGHVAYQAWLLVVEVLTLHLFEHPETALVVHLQLLVRLRSVLPEAQMVGTFQCCLLHDVFPYCPDQLSPRVVLGCWYLELARLVLR